jgi:RimJ/RimL family protein N-acetyltransferase
MDKDLIVRNLKKDDFCAIYKIRVELAKERAFVIYHKIPKKREYIKTFKRMLVKAKSRNAIYLVAEINKKVVGLCGVERALGDVKNHIGYLFIWISRNYRGMGLGTKLMKTMLKLAKKYFKIIRLDVAVANKIAIKLYSQLGFRKEGLLKKEYFINGKYYDAVVMSYYFRE